MLVLLQVSIIKCASLVYRGFDPKKIDLVPGIGYC